MSDKDFSHKVLTMLLANRNKGSIGKFLDKLNEHVKNKNISEEQKNLILQDLEDFFIEEHKIFASFSGRVEEIIGKKLTQD